jgi:hypothetical protein
MKKSKRLKEQDPAFASDPADRPLTGAAGDTDLDKTYPGHVKQIQGGVAGLQGILDGAGVRSKPEFLDALRGHLDDLKASLEGLCEWLDSEADDQADAGDYSANQENVRRRFGLTSRGFTEQANQARKDRISRWRSGHVAG